MRMIVPFVLAIGLNACGDRQGSEVQSAPRGSTVSIVEISPSVGIPLSPGQNVELRVKASYSLTSESGTLGLVVQDANNVPLAQTVNVVLQGRGTEEVSVSFVVPETKAVHVFTPLSAQGQSATTTVSSRAYKVTQR